MKDENHCCLIPVKDKYVAGHTANSASFFVQRYCGEPKRKISELLFLAAHTILSASKLNPTGIGDLEIVTITQSGVTHVRKNDINKLKHQSRKLDRKLEKVLLGKAPF
jgi:hypothetical protein